MDLARGLLKNPELAKKNERNKNAQLLLSKLFHKLKFNTDFEQHEMLTTNIQNKLV